MSKLGHHRQDEQLQRVLREWVVDHSLPLRFGETVWSRIQRAEAAPAKTTSLAKLFFSRVLDSLARPALAWACVVLFLAVGALVGVVEARRETARVNDTLRALYVQSV